MVHHMKSKQEAAAEETKGSNFIDEGPVKTLSGLPSKYEGSSAEEMQEDADMSLAMAGFAFFGMVLFIMWYMLRSCKNGGGKGHFDPSNPQSRG